MRSVKQDEKYSFGMVYSRHVNMLLHNFTSPIAWTEVPLSPHSPDATNLSRALTYSHILLSIEEHLFSQREIAGL